MANERSRLIVPALAPLYRALAPWTELAIRIVAGLSFVPHGYPKLANPAGAAAFFEEAGFSPALLWAMVVGLTEVFGGLFLAFGFLTRLVCIPILIFLVAAITTYNWQFGFHWNDGGIEYPLFWSIVVFHFLVHGAGPQSVDARIGREF
jgi:putative oxidoreductase